MDERDRTAMNDESQPFKIKWPKTNFISRSEVLRIIDEEIKHYEYSKKHVPAMEGQTQNRIDALYDLKTKFE